VIGALAERVGKREEHEDSGAKTAQAARTVHFTLHRCACFTGGDASLALIAKYLPTAPKRSSSLGRHT
jgi:hypothetical protein